MLLDKLKGVEARFEELSRLMADPASSEDYGKMVAYAKEFSQLEPLVLAIRQYRAVLDQRRETQAMLAQDDMRELAEEELAQLNARAEALEQEITVMLLPKDPRDQRDVIIEIRAGAGGDEAGLFAGDLYRMYTRYAERHGWKVELLSFSETGVGGFKEVVFSVKGDGAYSRFKYESGVHRVQRVPSTESQGRIHTSTATVAVMAEVDEIEIDIPEKDIRMDVYRSQGAGGQNVQKNSTAVRLTHLPTGMVVQCQDERSQLQNRIRAMAILRARLYEIELEKQQKAQEQHRRSQVGSGDRSEKIRTYNFPQRRVSDHRINLTVYNLEEVLEGDLDPFINELATREQAELLAEANL